MEKLLAWVAFNPCLYPKMVEGANTYGKCCKIDGAWSAAWMLLDFLLDSGTAHVSHSRGI